MGRREEERREGRERGGREKVKGGGREKVKGGGRGRLFCCLLHLTHAQLQKIDCRSNTSASFPERTTSSL